MATPTRTASANASTKRSTPRKPSVARRSHPKTSVEKAGDAVAGTTSSLVETIKANPVASAAIAAGVAGASALIWANRSQIAEQASTLGEKAGELGGKLGEQASAIGGKLSEKASALGEKVSAKYAAATGEIVKTQQEIIEEALTLKEVGKSDPMIAEQSKAGAVAY